VFFSGLCGPTALSDVAGALPSKNVAGDRRANVKGKAPQRQSVETLRRRESP